MFRGIVSIVLLLLSVAGCGAVSDVSGNSPAGPAPTVATPLVEVHRTGGLAGVDDTVRVDTAGGWTAGTRSGVRTSGTLDAVRLSALTALVAAPDWASEASTRSAGSTCADGFVYQVIAAGRTASSDDCRLESQPTLAKLARGVLADAKL